MPLERYAEKRDFAKTPEPGPSAGTDGKHELRYVIQKHAASRLHYDFRLELDGVLLSWAVPKGPSLDPKDKRLAVHVEDHPLDYADFEGVIPKGEYGGGSVIVWDTGTWEPAGDPHAAMEKGDFKFRLHGRKLRGGWVLVKLKPRGNEKGDNWLLIKERDDKVRSSDEYDVIAEEPRSALTGRTVEEVAAAGEVPADVAAADESAAAPPVSAVGSDPLVAPPELALCTLVTSAPTGPGWLAEVKYDGYRITVAVEDGSARVYSRSGADVTATYARIADAAAALPVSSALLDGEAVVLDERGASSFEALQKALGTRPESVVLVAFDLLHLNGHDLRGLPTIKRRGLLDALLEGLPSAGPLRIAPYVEGDAPALLEVACAQGLEGAVAKRADAPYPVGRTRSWLKVKCRRSQELVVGGFTLPEGSRTGFSALLVGYHAFDGGPLIYAGRVGSGFTQHELKTMRASLDSLAVDDPPFAEPPAPADKEVRWVRPELVVQVDFAEWTSEGVLRQPSYTGIRDDVDPESVKREEPEAPELEPAEEPVPDPPADTDPSAVLGVRISNPDKRLFPASDLTKLELAHYYERIAPLMLPEVAHRPLTLVRCPVGDGKGKCFYQRHPDRGMPDTVHALSHALHEHPEADEWLWVEDAAGLVALAQMGAAEIHSWLSRTDAPGRPDRLVFDLDPGPGVTWAGIVQGARVLKAELEALGLTAFVKSTGSKGLHVVAPLEPVWEFARVHALARAIADRVVADAPELYTAKMAKSQRSGRIFIDYVRNSEAASAVVPYSTRYLEGPSVALPLAWDELADDLDIRTFTPGSVLKRVSTGTDPWKDIDSASVGARVLKAAEKTLGVEG